MKIKTINSSIWDKDNFILFVIFFSSFLFVYYSPSITINRILFLIYLPLIYKSKKDYIWIAWLFIIVDGPGYLFKGGAFNDPNRIPLYPIMASVSISFFDLLLLTYLFKIISKKNHIQKKFIFSIEVIIFFYLMLFYILYSLAGFESSIIDIYRLLMPWFFAIVIFFLLETEDKFIRLNRILFPFAFIIFLVQIYSILSGEQFVNLFKGSAFIKSHLAKDLEESASAFRMVSSAFLNIYIITMALFYYNQKPRIFPKKYLILLVTICFFNAFITGTRGYLISILLIISLFSLFVLNKNRINTIMATLISLFLLALITTTTFPIIDRQLGYATERYETLFLLAQGDYTAGGTLKRISVRIPQIMKKVTEKPLLGYGFSKQFFEYADGDVGFHSLLFNAGYLGAFTIYLMIFRIIFKIGLLNNKTLFKTIYSNSLRMFAIGILGLLLFHHTTNMAFGFTPGAQFALYERYIIYGLFLVQFNVIYLATHERTISTLVKDYRINS